MIDYNEKLHQYFAEAVSWRRYLHQHPELSYQEFETAMFVAEHLRNWGIEVQTGVGGNGVVGIVKGSHPGATIALRADMDALPIQDEKSCDYASKVNGVTHACGHDGHTSTLLLVAKVLSENKEHLHGEIRLIFQHAEETTPGGAKFMIEQGVLEGVDAIYGIHLWSPLPVGHVYCSSGPMMAAADEFTIQIQGKGGHGGLPHRTVDSVIVGAHLVVNMQTVVSRNINPLMPCVVTIGSLQSGSAFNVIAEKCHLKGTVRTFDEDSRIKARARIESILEHTCTMFEAEYELNYMLGYPPLVNYEAEVVRFNEVATSLFGSEHVHSMEQLMAAEDFAYYLEQVPGCYMIVGAGNVERDIIYPHHHPKFDFDEAAMLHAAKLLIGMVQPRIGR